MAAAPDQGAVDQAAGKPAPQAAEQQGLAGTLHRQQTSGVGFDLPPQAAADGFDAGQARPPVGQIQPHGDHQQAGDTPQDQVQAQTMQGPAEAANDGTGQGIAGDAPGVVGQQQAPERPAASLRRRDGHGERPHQTATHADAVATAEQPQSQCSQ